MAPFVSLQSIGYRVDGDLLLIVALVRWAVYMYTYINVISITSSKFPWGYTTLKLQLTP